MKRPIMSRSAAPAMMPAPTVRLAFQLPAPAALDAASAGITSENAVAPSITPAPKPRKQS
jgi:hypothetical protein